MANILYRFYSATGQLLYVGITMNPAQRFRAHRDTKAWWSDVVGITLEHYTSREELADAERRAIQVEHPLHNIVRAKVRPNESAWVGTDPEPDLEPGPEPDAGSVLDRLFSNREPRRHTTFGYITDAEYKRHLEDWQDKMAARRECTLCDPQGYRGLVVCDHVDRDVSKSLKDELKIVHGGAE